MNRIRTVVAAVAMVAVSAGLTLVAPEGAVAQGSEQASSVPAGASTPKQVRKAQRKAARKAARAKRNAELSTLEKNGYRQSGDKTNYPENLQNAQSKADAGKAAAGASSPGQ